MRVNLNGVVTGRRVWKKIVVREGQDFEIELRRPTYEELLQDAAMGWGESWEQRVLSNLVGWRGVETEDGTPVPFTQDRFAVLCSHIPAALQHTLRHLNELYFGLGEDEQKNFETPPVSGSAVGGNSEAVNSTGSPN